MLAQSRLLERAISPPPSRRDQGALAEHDHDDRKAPVIHSAQIVPKDTQRHGSQAPELSSSRLPSRPSLAAIEAGKAVIDDHIAHFSAHFQATARETDVLAPSLPRLSTSDFEDLYQRNLIPHGRHFVVHQHDHPISGVHYDLRLQFSETSTISFAIPYGLPGNANSIRPNRMAIETRVHNLWNNLIESASRATGSLLIWDTGEYEVLPYREERKASTTDNELSDHEDLEASVPLSESERLFADFQHKHLRLRLHGRRLPAGYTISLRLPKNNYQGRVRDPARKRPKLRKSKSASVPAELTDSENEELAEQLLTPYAEDTIEDNEHAANASENEDDASIRANNAYTGATNTIGSVHQRHWFLSLDKKRTSQLEPFVVMGRDVERSVVTGRSADDILSDEGVTKFVGRKMWRPITE